MVILKPHAPKCLPKIKTLFFFFFSSNQKCLADSSKPLERTGNDTTAISLIFPFFIHSLPLRVSNDALSGREKKKKKKARKSSKITASVRADLVYHSAQPSPHPLSSSSPAQRISSYKIFQLSSKLQGGKERLKVTDSPTRKMLILTNCSGGSLNHSQIEFGLS